MTTKYRRKLNGASTGANQFRFNLQPASNDLFSVGGKLELLALLSHQIRSPLYSIRNAVAELKQDCSQYSAERKSFIGIIDRSTDRIVALAEQCLRLMELEDRRRSAQEFPLISILDLESIVLRTASSLHDETGQQVRRIKVELATREQQQALVRCDSFLVEQALAILLANALQYGSCIAGPDRPDVVVRVSNNEKSYRIEVIDFGIGIAPEHQAFVFQPFYRAPSSALVRRTGSGLGLAIAKTIAESHGGCIGLKSEPGVGSNFWFDLPRFCNAHR